jgi:hypothetical protein
MSKYGNWTKEQTNESQKLKAQQSGNLIVKFHMTLQDYKLSPQTIGCYLTTSSNCSINGTESL